MVNPFICGSSSFGHQLEKEDDDAISQCSTPSKSSPKKPRKGSFFRSRDDKESYSKRDLDKEDDDAISQCSTPSKRSPKKSRKSSFFRSKDDKNPYSKRDLDKEEDDDDAIIKCSTPSESSPKKSSKRSFFRIRNDKNPYSKRGLDKFSALLAEVEEKKQTVYKQIPSDDISLLRFTYSDTERMKPIVVRARDKKQENNITSKEKERSKTVVDDKEALKKHHIKPSTLANEAKQEVTNNMKNDFSIKKIKVDLWKPSFYLPAILILILVFLVFFGKSFAILCTSIGWYFLATVKKGSSSSKREKKKEHTRKSSDIIVNDWLSSPKTVLCRSPEDDELQLQKGDRRKIW